MSEGTKVRRVMDTRAKTRAWREEMHREGRDPQVHYAFEGEGAEELLAGLRPPTPDDVGIKTVDGRHLKTKDEILGWWAEVEAERAAGRFVDLDAESA